MKAPFLVSLALVAGHAPEPFPPDAALALVTHNAVNFKDFTACLSVDGTDPSAQLLAAARKSLPLAVPQSECTKPDKPVVHRPSGKRAAIVSISDFKRTSATTATAEYSVNSGPLAGNWSIAKFTFSNGAWTLVAVEGYMAS